MSEKTQTEEKSQILPNDYEAIQSEMGVPIGEGMGVIKCHNSVFKEIAGYAAVRVKGVASIGGRSTLGDYILFRDKDPGIDIQTAGEDESLGDNEVSAAFVVTIYFGHNIYDVCTELQRQVKDEIENTTGYIVKAVNVNVQGLMPFKENKEEEEKQALPEPEEK